MGKALEVLIGRAVNPGAAPVAVTAGSGDSFAVRSAPTAAIYLENLWAREASAGILRVRSPRLHDNVQGIRHRIPAGVTRALWADSVRQRLYSQDTLTVELAGGAAETDTCALMLHYDDIPGLDARLSTWAQIHPRIVNVFGQEIATAAGATAGDWGPGTAVNASFDNFKPNTDYAILGYEVDALCLAVTFRGADTGNVRIGGPGPLEPVETRDWFLSLSQAIGGPAIPVFNSAGRAAMLVFVADSVANTAVNVTAILAELSGSHA